MSSIAIDHQLARMAAGRLDMLADDLEGGLLQHSDALRPVPAAADPVSRHTAQVLRQVSASFEQSCLGGVGELRKIAANLRSHADLVGDSDDDAVQSFQRLA
ncbi:PE domain-containing protein [Nocardia sp. NPDC059691]|uniref:PE domain-containing protein n=1 Tax=Nocardia sp. NPDC059691 TaxID=3346908 RepID=UPI00368A833C